MTFSPRRAIGRGLHWFLQPVTEPRYSESEVAEARKALLGIGPREMAALAPQSEPNQSNTTKASPKAAGQAPARKASDEELLAAELIHFACPRGYGRDEIVSALKAVGADSEVAIHLVETSVFRRAAHHSSGSHRQ